MTNHVHLVVVPSQAESMPRAMREVNGSYARYRNAIDRTSGHLWQNRYYSCVVEEERLGVVMRYVERNPVRAHMVRSAEDYVWSSAVTHLGGPNPLGLISMKEWSARWSFEEWAQVIRTGDDQIAAIREATHTGRPLGSEAFTHSLEQRLSRKLTRGTPGRPKRSTAAA